MILQGSNEIAPTCNVGVPRELSANPGGVELNRGYEKFYYNNHFFVSLQIRLSINATQLNLPD